MLPATVQKKSEMRTILFQENSFKLSTESDVSDDDFLGEKNDINLIKTSTAGSRHQIHRGARKLTRFVLIALLFPMLFFLVYIPIYNSVQSRRCK